MSPKLKPRLSVESLEGRETPSATLTFNGSTLTLRGDNTPNNVLITETAGVFNVKVNAASLGNYRATNLSLTMGNGNDTVNLALDATGLPGTLSYSGGNGSDSFSTDPSAPGSPIRGNVSINTGLSTPLGVAADAADESVKLNNVNLGGTITTVTGSAGSAGEYLDLEASKVAGTLSVTNIYDTELGFSGNAARAASVNNLIINNTQKNTDARVGLRQGPGNALFVFSGSAVAGNVTYTGGTGIDDVLLPGGSIGATPVSVGGNVTDNAGAGKNTLALGNITAGVTVNGDVGFTAGTGNDTFFFDSGSVVNGSVNLNLGDGDNTISLGTVGTMTLGGSLTATAGNGNNTVQNPTSASSIGGNLSFTFGNGTNGFTFDDNLTVGGNVTYQGGSGANTVAINSDTFTNNLHVTLGGGPSTVSFAPPSGTYSGNATIDFGVGFGPKTFNPGATVFTGNFVLLNYP